MKPKTSGGACELVDEDAALHPDAEKATREYVESNCQTELLVRAYLCAVTIAQMFEQVDRDVLFRMCVAEFEKSGKINPNEKPGDECGCLFLGDAPTPKTRERAEHAIAAAKVLIQIHERLLMGGEAKAA